MTSSTANIPAKNIAFDVVGTLTSYDAFYTAIDEQIGDLLREHGIRPYFFGFTWIEVAEREYAYASISNAYTPYEAFIRSLFWRILHQSGIPSPRERVSEAALEAIMEGYASMTLRPDAGTCIRALQDAGFRVWYFTMGGTSRVAAWLREGGVDVEDEGKIVGCDGDGVGKPDLRAYRPLLERIKDGGEGEGEAWFAAAHAWDAGAARRAGFKAAYCTVWEKEEVRQLFGAMDVVAGTLPEMAEKIVAATKRR